MDIVGAFQKVRQSYIDYVKTAFGTQYPGLEAERQRLLERPGTICQEPWIELIPRYRLSGKKIGDLAAADLPGLHPDNIPAFQNLVACGLVGGYELYEHQVKMLRQVLVGESAVVTSGTGSGKTEAFLLPLFAYLVQESAGWSNPGPRLDHQDDWWKDDGWRNQCWPRSGKQTNYKRSLRVPQRSNERRDAAVRGLVLYPMNALVEDQLSRLRTALDSPKARDWFNKHRDGNRFYFGRYNANTPVAGHEDLPPNANGIQRPDHDRIQRLANLLKEAEGAANAAEQHDHANGETTARYFFPRLDGSEMRSRWDMQDHPPDILITNFSMLSIMLMRDADSNIFEETKRWLQKDSSVFHLIIDELHLYRGTAGTEVAYLLKLLLLRLGLSPDSPKLRVLGSSASLDPGDPQSLRFLSEFFGSNWINSQIIPGHPVDISSGDTASMLPTEPFVTIAELAGTTGQELDAEAVASALLRSTGKQPAGKECDLETVLESENFEVGARLLAACSKDGGTRAIGLGDFGRQLFGDDCDQNTTQAATQGLLIARDLCGLSEQLPSFRLHWFFKNIEGLWACTEPGCGCAPAEMAGGRTTGQLFSSARILCDNTDDPHRVLDLLYCEVCGTTLFGGSRFELEANKGWELLITDADIEGIPDRQPARFVERRMYQEYAVFWPAGHASLADDAKSWPQPIVGGGTDTVRGRWRKASLDPDTGRVGLGNQGLVHGYAFVVGTDSSKSGALPAVCPLCAADYRYRKFRKSPIRGFRTGFGKVTQILSKEMFYFLPEDSRKLVVFSDSRQNAAELANGIEKGTLFRLGPGSHVRRVEESSYSGACITCRHTKHRSSNIPGRFELGCSSPSSPRCPSPLRRTRKHRREHDCQPARRGTRRIRKEHCSCPGENSPDSRPGN